MDHKRQTKLAEAETEGGPKTTTSRLLSSSKMKSSKSASLRSHCEENSRRQEIEVITIDELSELVTGPLEENEHPIDKPITKLPNHNSSIVNAANAIQNLPKTEINPTKEEAMAQTKGQYEHFNVFEDYQFIQCLNDFKSPSGMRTRHGYFEKLSSEFGRTMCSIRRRWERLNVLTASQKELVAEFFTKFSDVADQRRIVFAKNCANVTLMSVDSTSVPLEEIAFFKQLKFKHMQIEPSIESESSSESESEESKEDVEEPLQVEEEIVEKTLVLEEPIVEEQTEEPKPISVQMPDLPKEPETSEDSLLLDISGDEEGVHFLQRLKKKITPADFESSSKYVNHKAFSDCHSSISDIIEDAIEPQFDPTQFGQKREHLNEVIQLREQTERKRTKLDSSEHSMVSLKQKVEALKLALGDPEQFIGEKTELLRNLLLYFSHNYRCDLDSLREIVESQDKLNMEDLKFRLCLRYLSQQPDLSTK